MSFLSSKSRVLVNILGIPSIYPSFGGMDEYFPIDYEFKFTQFD